MKQLLTPMYLTFCLISLTVSSVCFSAEIIKNPDSINFANMNGNPSTVIRFDCLEDESPTQITCYIGELRIWGNTDSTQDGGFDKKLQGLTEQKKQELVVQTQEVMCTEDMIERSSLTSKVNPFLLPIAKQMSLFCKQPTFDALVKMKDESKQHNSQTCLTSIGAQVTQFTYNEKTTRWVSKTGPSGLCGGINTKEIYQTGEDATSGWIYTTLSVATKKDARKGCTAAYDERLYQYKSLSTDIPKLYKLNCTYIHF